VPTCLIVPIFAVRGRDQRPAVVAMLVLAALGFLGLLVAPDAAPALWATLLGFSQGGLLALSFLFFSLRTTDQAQASRVDPTSLAVNDQAVLDMH